jgi:hypothetical protein
MSENAIRDFWRENVRVDRPSPHIGEPFTMCRRLTCADGFSMSVQASHYHYSKPRTLVESGDYASWEIGFPSAAEYDLLPFAEEDERPTETVYGFVPTEVVNRIIAKHGGLAEAEGRA